MLITITDQKKILALIEEYHLEHSATLQQIFIEVCSVASFNGNKTCCFIIKEELMKFSYRTNAPMIGVTLRNRTDYPHVRSFYKEGAIHLMASDKRIPTSFKAKGIIAIQDEGRFEVLRRLIPRSYRLRPVVFLAILQKATGLNLKFQRKHNSIVWKLKK